MTQHPCHLALNPAADKSAPYGAAQSGVIDDAAHEEARATISRWPGYKATPLVSLPGIAGEAGVGEIHYKDESGRFNLGSFKALGGAYAVARLLMLEVTRQLPDTIVSPESILAGDHARIVSGITVCCATDGNHGRSVAWGAQTYGCKCVIFIHATVSKGRAEAIEAFGSKVVRTAGNYDDSVRDAQDEAEKTGWFVVSDTSYEGYVDIPRDVMTGYTVMAAEADEQTPYDAPPTHIFIHTGVGGLAAAVASEFWRRYGSKRPTIILCDPDKAACWWESYKSGSPTAVHGDLETVMAGLACGEVSILAWTILKPGADAVMTITDEQAKNCMRLLAKGTFGDAPMVAGESAVAGLAGLLGAAGDEQTRKTLGLTDESRILLFGTEGATDPEIYREIVGRPASAIGQSGD
jgi:diaminopropionate ammonia-lyase